MNVVSYSGYLFICACFSDDKDNIFGGFATDSWRPGKLYYIPGYLRKKVFCYGMLDVFLCIILLILLR
jgi:hypothetical protein